MGRPASQMWTWILCVLWCGISVAQPATVPHYMVTIPAVLEAGAETKFCVNLLEPNEMLAMTVTLRSQDKNTTLYEKTSSTEFHDCIQFQVPLVTNEEVQTFEVEVRGNTFHSKEARKVMIKAYQPKTFIQTDKPIYLPGQTVHFRVVTLDSKLRLANELYNIIEMKDPFDNRIGQWLNETSNSKILQLSYSLNSEAREGTYEIIVSVGERKTHHSFKVEKYVLPKFAITLNVKDDVSIGSEEFDVEVCAKYTYGQPVPGLVIVQVSRPIVHYFFGVQPRTPEELEITEPRNTKTKETDKTGCATFEFKISTFTKIDKKVLEDRFDISAMVEEEGTGVSHSQRNNIRISYVIGNITFVDTPKIYEQGKNIEGKVKAVHYNGTSIGNMQLYLFTGERWSAQLVQNLTTDINGVATFSLSTDTFSGDVKLYVSNSPTLEYPGYRTAYYDIGAHTVSISQPASHDTKTVSSLELKRDTTLSCDKEEEISVLYTFVHEPKGSVDIVYLVLSRGAIVIQGRKQVQLEDKAVNDGMVSFKLTMSTDMAPEIQVVAYAVLSSKDVIAHSADFPTEKCFSNKVSLEFSTSSAVPGEETKMHLSAQPDSLCGVSAVDQSVLVKEPGKTLNADKIFNLLPVRKVTYTPYQIQDSTPCLHMRPKRYVLPYPGEDQKDAHKIFQDVGLKVATNLQIKVPSCLRFKGREYHLGYSGFGVQYSRVNAMAAPDRIAMSGPPGLGGSLAPSAEPIETVRTFFPETWIWDLVETGETGSKDVSVTVPDTITTWETETYCLSSHGFGLAPRQKLTVFQPFFLELTLPYSIIRGENFELKATVFNYLTSCIMLKVTADPSSDFTLTPLSGDQYTSCLCGSERKTLSWTMTPTTLGLVNVTVTAEAITSHISCDNEIASVPERGRIDVVTRPLIVKAEGIEVTKTHNWLLCPKGNTLAEETEMHLPENVISGSARATVSVLGDILGRALKNLDGLLQMPYGCGEQNMALLAPNIYILEYLQSTQQLTPAIKEKASNFLTSGYQRQLNYKDNFGAYSTFGSGPGNTWLTAFVMITFFKAQAFIYIEPRIIEDCRSWLERQQLKNGCFKLSGKLFNDKLRGGVSDEVTLTAYVTAALLEMKIPADNHVVKKSLSCLKESVNDFSNTYTVALLAYVFSLAGDVDTRAEFLDHLDSVTRKEGDLCYWCPPSEKSSPRCVETTSYVLLARLSSSFATIDMKSTTSAVRWLSGQQNYYGGFFSTQDTAVALKALALYATLIFSPEGSGLVTVSSPSENLVFHVNSENKHVYQERMLQNLKGKYLIKSESHACTSVQVSLHYNIPAESVKSPFSVEAEVVFHKHCDRGLVTLKLKSSHNGDSSCTNMVVIDITIPSGFCPVPESLSNLKHGVLVKNVEYKDGHVILYLWEVTRV
ncbi:alpha-2-macroglobulin [Nematolebias whitei]|uniref:alpha-2-macroglobulin n=1 Tax=Nematolebias whitei TaxID=451745 RepID=UPI001897FF6B|nr:alpha-2-macroglobulin [Nematolebias whitei]